MTRSGGGGAIEPVQVVLELGDMALEEESGRGDPDATHNPSVTEDSIVEAGDTEVEEGGGEDRKSTRLNSSHPV